MRRRRGGDGERFELGGYWLGRLQPDGYVYLHWYDERTGRGGRRSLKTKAWEEAKEILAGIVVAKPRRDPGGGVPDPHRVLLVSVLNHYLDHRARKLPSSGPAERAVALVTEYLFDVKKLPDAARADAFGLDLQEAFVVWSAETYGHSAKYISRNLSVIAAAMHYAAEEQAIDDPDEGRRIVRLMSAAPKIHYDPEWIARTAAIAAPQRRDWLPTIEQMGRFIDCIRSEHVFRYVIIGLNTWARAEAIMELDFKRQINFEDSLIDLNPPGRLQNIKRRPVIRLTANLRAWAQHWKVARPLVFKGGAVEDIKKAFQLANYRWLMLEAGVGTKDVEWLMAKGREEDRAGVVAAIESVAKTGDVMKLVARIRAAPEGDPDPATVTGEEMEASAPEGGSGRKSIGARRITRRVIRSFMATRVRAQREVKVDREQREVWLGHQGQDTTSNYEIMDPAYLRECAAATDHVIGRIGLSCRRSLWPEGVQPELPLGRPARR